MLDGPVMPHLRSLSFNVADWPEVTAHLLARAPSIHELVFTVFSGLDKLRPSNALHQILQSTQIRTLDLEEHSWDIDDGLVSLPPDCLPSLERLTWSGGMSDSLHCCQGTTHIHSSTLIWCRSMQPSLNYVLKTQTRLFTKLTLNPLLLV